MFLAFGNNDLGWLRSGKIQHKVHNKKNPGMAEAIPGKFGGGRESR